MAVAPGQDLPSGSPLLDRSRELTAFGRLLGEAERGNSGLVVVEGPAGIGKSFLLAELRRRARGEGLRVVAARGSRLEREFAFGVVRQLFDPVLAGPGERERRLTEAAGPARAVFGDAGAGASGGDDASFAVLHGLYWLTADLAQERPLLLAVDDLHWCDPPSLRFLTYLARRLEGLGAILAVALRTSEPGVDTDMIDDIADAPEAVRMQPAPLGEAAVAELIRARLGAQPDSTFTAACARATGGNPLLLRQLLTSLEADGVAPEARNRDAIRDAGARAVSATVLRRLRRLPEEASAVAHAVAVLGDGAELSRVAVLADLDERTVAGGWTALARADIMRREPPLGFVHPLVGDAVYHHLPPGERQLHHEKAARLLFETGARAEEVAAHLFASPPRGRAWVVDVLREAAAAARSRGAAETAAAFLRRALEEPPGADRRIRVLVELGLAETLTSAPAAAEHLRAAWDGLDDGPERAHVAAALARTLIYTGTADEAVAFASRAAASLPRDLVDERQALHAIALMGIPLGARDHDGTLRLERLRIEGAGPGAKMLAAAAAEVGALTGASADACAALAEEALAGGVLIDADPGFIRNAAPWVLVMADREEALAAWDAMRAHAHRRGSLFGFLGTNLWCGASLLWRGDLREAEAMLVTALENAAAWGLTRSGAAYGPALAFTGAVRILRGDLDGARELLDPAARDARRVDTSRLTLRSRVELLLAEGGRDEEALAAADELAGRLGGIVNPGWAPWRSLKARALHRLGRTGEAVALAQDELAHARAFGSPSVVGRSLRVLGTLEGPDGIGRLRQAIELLERSSAKLELAFALVALGAALRRERKPGDAREPLRRGLELADRCGAEPLAVRARTELHAAGGRPRRTALTGVESLTASERRVAELAADGRTNREIAQALYVTLKTVELHLSNAYRKLGIRSRRDLSRALER